MLKLVVPPKIKSLSYQEYDKIATVPFNRDVEIRIKKTKKTKKFDILRFLCYVNDIGGLCV